MSSGKRNAGSEIILTKRQQDDPGTNSPGTGSNVQKKSYAALADALPEVKVRANLTTNEPEIWSPPKLSKRQEKIIELMMTIELRTQIVLTDDQRAEMVDLLTDSAWELNVIRGAAILISRGEIQMFHKINMATFKEAVRLFCADAGKRVEYYNRGVNDGRAMERDRQNKLKEAHQNA